MKAQRNCPLQSLNHEKLRLFQFLYLTRCEVPNSMHIAILYMPLKTDRMLRRKGSKWHGHCDSLMRSLYSMCSYSAQKIREINTQAFGKGVSVFFKSMAPGRSLLLQWQALHLRTYGQHKLNLLGLQNKKKKQSWWVVKPEQIQIGLGKRGNYFQDTLYIILKELILFYYKHLSNMQKSQL